MLKCSILSSWNLSFHPSVIVRACSSLTFLARITQEKQDAIIPIPIHTTCLCWALKVICTRKGTITQFNFRSWFCTSPGSHCLNQELNDEWPPWNYTGQACKPSRVSEHQGHHLIQAPLRQISWIWRWKAHFFQHSYTFLWPCFLWKAQAVLAAP